MEELEKYFLERETVPQYEAVFMLPKIPSNAEMPGSKEYLSLVMYGMNPQGSGTVTLSAADPEDAAIIDPNSLLHTFDKWVLVDVVIDVIEI